MQSAWIGETVAWQNWVNVGATTVLSGAVVGAPVPLGVGPRSLLAVFLEQWDYFLQRVLDRLR